MNAIEVVKPSYPLGDNENPLTIRPCRMWSCTLQTKDGPYPIRGYFASIFVRVDGVWKERMTCYNMATETK